MPTMNHVTLAAMALAVAMLAGCRRDPPPRLEPEPEPAKSGLAVTSENGMLTIDPATIDLCQHPEGVVAVDVRSDASASGTNATEIVLQSQEGRKVWSGSGAVFRGRTGVWMREGDRIILVDKRGGTDLAAIAISSRTCQR